MAGSGGQQLLINLCIHGSPPAVAERHGLLTILIVGVIS